MAVGDRVPMSIRSVLVISCVVASGLCGTQNASAADWVSLLPRDPYAWVDLDSVRTEAAGSVRVQLSLSGNPSRPFNARVAMRLVYKVIDCKIDGAVYDVDSNGNVIPDKPPASEYEKILAVPKDTELDKALFERICQNKKQ